MFPTDLPKSTSGREWRFTTAATVNNTQWTPFQVPEWATFLNFFVMGGGGGGGGGHTGDADTPRGGGGGGGCSAVNRVTVPAAFLPRTLFIQVGRGGAGGAASTAGTTGLLSYVTISPDITATNTIARSNNVGAGGGGPGTASAGGAGGTAGTAVNAANSTTMAGMGHWNTIIGLVGAAGGAHTGANGANIGFSGNQQLCTGGTGGAGTTSGNFAGGAFGNINFSFISQNRPANPLGGSNNGSGGYGLNKPLFFYGGTGGSSSNADVGGNGGNGGHGSGGGGGGGGTTGGRGGDGGNGIVIITAI